MRIQIFIGINIALVFILLLSPITAPSQTNDAVNQKTFLIYKKTRNITLHDEKFIWEKIQQLSYIQSRLFRSFCRLHQVSAIDIERFLDELPQHTLPFKTAELLDVYVLLPGADSTGYNRLLVLLNGGSLATITVLHKIIQLPGLQSSDYLLIAEQASKMDPSGQWALKAILEKGQQHKTPIIAIMDNLDQLSTYQLWLVEKIFATVNENVDIQTETISAINTLSNSASINLAAAFSRGDIAPEKSLYWLHSFFLHSPEVQEKLFTKFYQQPHKTRPTRIVYA